MQLRSLHMATAIALALAGVGITAVEAAPSGAVGTSSAQLGVGPTDLAKPSSSEPIRFVPLRELATMLDKDAFSSNKGVKDASAIARGATQAPSHGAAPLTETAIVMASSLAEPEVMAQVHDLYEAGVPVAVVRDGDPSNVALTARTFGAAMRAKVAIYSRGSDGKVEAFGAGGDDEVLTPADMSDRVATTVNMVTQRMDEAARSSPATIRAAQSMPTVNNNDVPRINMGMTMSGRAGSFVRTDVTVVRDTTRSQDFKRVISRATYQANPVVGGNSGPNNSSLTIPDRYHLWQAIQRSDGARTDAIDIFPKSNGSTDITFSETKTSQTSYGFNIAPEVERGLATQVPNASAKAGFGFNFAKSYTDEKSIQFTVKDYYVAASSIFHDRGFSQTTWDLRLADNIRNNPRHFGSKSLVNNTTPMMRQGSAQTYAAWNLPGSFEGTVKVHAGFDIEMRNFIPSRSTLLGWDASTLKMVVEVDTSSPFLTREPTVLIRSSSENNSCLAGESDNLVYVDTCSSAFVPVQLRTHLQWTLDELGRYRNRHSKQCMQEESGNLIMAPCSLDQRQRFRWVADRIHSLVRNDDTGLRLVNNGYAVMVLPGTQTLPPNINHPLLAPWSSYPGATEIGDTVPGFLNATPVSSDWVGRYKTIPDNERWDVIPLRFGL